MNARDREFTRDLREPLLSRGTQLGRQAEGAVSVAFLRGEQHGQAECIRWLKRRGHKRAAVALQRSLGMNDDGSIG